MQGTCQVAGGKLPKSWGVGKCKRGRLCSPVLSDLEACPSGSSESSLPFVGIYRSTSPWRIHLSAARQMVLHGSHQYTPVMFALIYQHQRDPSWDSSFWWVTHLPRSRGFAHGGEENGLILMVWFTTSYKFKVSTKRRINMIQHDST